MLGKMNDFLPFRRKKSPLDSPDVIVRAQGPGWLAFCVSALGLLGVLYAAWRLALPLVEQTNQHVGRGEQVDAVTGKVLTDQDQKSNIIRTIKARQYLQPDVSLGVMDNICRAMPHDGDGVIAPLWPWVASRLVEQDHLPDEKYTSDDDRRLFERGKWLNITMVLVFVWLLGLILARTFRPGAALAVLLLGTFGALLPRAAYFQPEPLYFMFFFVAWVCALKLLRENTIWMHGVFGLVAGCGYLAKTSMEPLVVAWLGAASLRWLVSFFRKESAHDDDLWTGRNHFLGLLAFAVGWGVVCAPFYAANKEKYGNARHSYPAYWMWEDDFAVGEAWSLAHHNAEKLEAIAPGEMPSLEKYRKTHTPEEMQNRLWNGIFGEKGKLDRLINPRRVVMKKDKPFEGWKHILQDRGWYLGGAVALLLAAGILFLTQWGKGRTMPGTGVPAGGWFCALFTVVAVAGYTVAYGWYDPIGRGDRFMLSLYLPIVFSCVWGGEALVSAAVSRRCGRWLPVVWGVLVWALNGVVIWRLTEVLRNPVFMGGTA